MSDVTRLIASAREIAPFSEDEQLLFDLARELEKAQPRIIKTAGELDTLPAASHIWGSSHRQPTVPGTGSPYAKLEDGEWWDYDNEYAVPANDIMLPATVLFDPKEETK